MKSSSFTHFLSESPKLAKDQQFVNRSAPSYPLGVGVLSGTLAPDCMGAVPNHFPYERNRFGVSKSASMHNKLILAKMNRTRIVALTAYSLVLFLLFPPEAGDLGRIGFYVVFVLVVLFNILLFFYLDAKLGKTPKDARTFFFQCATVEVEGALEMIFAECLRAVKNLNAYALEFDFSRRYLEATVGASLKSFGGVLCVQIEQKDDTRYIVRVNVERRFSLPALTNSSWTMAYFLEQFLGR